VPFAATFKFEHFTSTYDSPSRYCLSVERVSLNMNSLFTKLLGHVVHQTRSPVRYM